MRAMIWNWIALAVLLVPAAAPFSILRASGRHASGRQHRARTCAGGQDRMVTFHRGRVRLFEARDGVPDDAGVGVSEAVQTVVAFQNVSAQQLAAMRPGEVLESSVFDLGGHPWQVLFYPGGIGRPKFAIGEGLGFSSGTGTPERRGEGGWGQGWRDERMAMRPTHQRLGRSAVYLRYAWAEEAGGVTESGAGTAPGADSSPFVDAVFSLQVIGQQKAGRRFDVAFDCGMRFCTPQDANAADGRCNDWGAHVMPQAALADFVDAADTLSVRVVLQVFGSWRCRGDEEQYAGVDGGGAVAELGGVGKRAARTTDPMARVGNGVLRAATLGLSEEARAKNGVYWSYPEDIKGSLRAGQVFIPSLGLPPWREGDEDGASWLQTRERMFAAGCYPGIEYRAMGLRHARTGAALFSTRGLDARDIVVRARPIYPVVQELEREWPLDFALDVMPVALTQAMYNTATLVLVSGLSAAFIASAFVLSEAVSVYKIPSRSMDPTILSGDLLLVEKLSSKVGLKPTKGEIVLFTPPKPLRDVVAKTGGKVGARDLFVKRVAASPGDHVRVDSRGSVYVNSRLYDHRQAALAAAGGMDLKDSAEACDANGGGVVEKLLLAPDADTQVPAGSSFVLGDCGQVSVDSRVWGPLDDADVVGRPVLRLWPPPRFGLVQ